tara:strand:+ start:2792 stop:3088 length:297 start_codon:yes stop_codon:yes gene_type:complete
MYKRHGARILSYDEDTYLIGFGGQVVHLCKDYIPAHRHTLAYHQYHFYSDYEKTFDSFKEAIGWFKNAALDGIRLKSNVNAGDWTITRDEELFLYGVV